MAVTVREVQAKLTALSMELEGVQCHEMNIAHTRDIDKYYLRFVFATVQ